MSVENPYRQSQGPVTTRRFDQITLAPAAIRALTNEHARFLRFVRTRVGINGDAEELLQNCLQRALQRGGELRRGERAVAWFYRILRNAIADHYREQKSRTAAIEALLADAHAADAGRVKVPDDWEAAVCTCFRGLLPTLKPRYAEVVRRIDVQGESKEVVAKALKVRATTMDVLLHRARRALRRRLEIFCGACSREHCLACACAVRKRGRKEEV